MYFAFCSFSFCSKLQICGVWENIPNYLIFPYYIQLVCNVLRVICSAFNVLVVENSSFTKVLIAGQSAKGKHKYENCFMNYHKLLLLWDLCAFSYVGVTTVCTINRGKNVKAKEII